MTQNKSSLIRGVKFQKGPGYKKYTAILPDHIYPKKSHKKRVHFGDRRYEHYKDTVPKRQGGKQWSHKDHLDSKRRKSYRARHGANGYHKKLYSPAWFSYYFLW